jgi:hypothetical protein
MRRDAFGAFCVANLLHVGVAFLLQTGMGFVIAQWPQSDGAYPAEAHETAMGALIGLEVAAFAWFAVAPRRQLPIPSGIHSPNPRPHNAGSRLASDAVIFNSRRRKHLPGRQAIGWRLAAASIDIALLEFGRNPLGRDQRANGR